MPSNENEKTAAFIDLLRREPDDTYALRVRQAYAEIESIINLPSHEILKVICAAIDAELEDHVLINSLPSFLSDTDLVKIADRLSSDESLLAYPDGLAGSVAFQAPGRMPREFVSEIFDFEQWGKNGDPYASPATFHLTFEDGAQGQPHIHQRRHPTWHFPASSPQLRLGGPGKSKCGSCGQQLIHLITLENLPRELPVSLPRIILETCNNCFQPAYYSHDDDGIPHRITPAEKEAVILENVPIREQWVRYASTPERWLRQSWSDDGQNLFKLGGFPSWIQYEETPNMLYANHRMQLLAQFNSYLPLEGGGEILWGSGGVLYVFWDDKTRTSCHFAQWT